MADTNGMIIDDEVRGLVARIESPEVISFEQIEKELHQLVTTLDRNCKKPDVQQRYQEYAKAQDALVKPAGESALTHYPIGLDDYAESFDPLQDEQAFWNCWSKHGFVVGKGVVSKETCEKTKQRVRDIASELSDGKFSIDDPKTYEHIPADPSGTPIISRGFFEVYHDDSLAQLRQAIRLYIHHVVIHGRADLWTSFDRYGVKLAGHKESKGLPLHVDQNPVVHPEFHDTQGVLALTDCPVERGTYVAVPGSRAFFQEYAKLSKARGEDYRGKFVETNKESSFTKLLQEHAQPIPLRAGDIVSWDSRTTHANSPNLSGDPRIVAYISAGPAAEQNLDAIAARGEAFRTGAASVAIKTDDAHMRASTKPRYTDPAALAKVRKLENLSALGRLLYSQDSYDPKKSR